MNGSIFIGAFGVAFDPLLPNAALLVLGALCLGFALAAMWLRPRGVLWRLMAVFLLVTALLNPSILREERHAEKDVAVLLVDRSPSQQIDGRDRETEAARAALEERLGQLPDLDVKVIEAGREPDIAEKGTRLFDALRQGLADLPQDRLAGIIAISDGQVRDAPANPESAEKLDLHAPFHLILTGDPDAGDRRLLLRETPSFGLVGKTADIKLRVDDLGADKDAQGNATVAVSIKRDGVALESMGVPLGQEVTVPLTIAHGGQNVFEIAVGKGPQELTLANNSAVVTVNGVRDRLKVLFVSGEPYPGERSWRNLLKSDPSVDLIHFTILRPPNKQDATPISELALIAFPIDELFDIKLKEFDLIIFDRFQHLGLLPDEYFQHIVDYVRDGGALLEAAGPSSAGQFSLYHTPLLPLFAAVPTGNVIARPFRPQLSDIGTRHPVTADLLPPNDERSGQENAGTATPAARVTEPHWGRWFRQIPATASRGAVVMTGADGLPLLVLDRVGKGRVAQLFSDHLWLWSKGFEGGGPQAELVRRTAHWLMQEPDLEEEDLRATIVGSRLEITRRSLAKEPGAVTVTAPDGKETTLALEDRGHGRFGAAMDAQEAGLYRAHDSTHTAFAASGTLNSVEFEEPRTSPEPLSPIVTASKGGITFFRASGLPEIRRTSTHAEQAGPEKMTARWFGLKRNNAYTVTGLRQMPLLPALFALLFAIVLTFLAWRREGR